MTTSTKGSPTPIVLIADDMTYVIQSWQRTLDDYGIIAVSATTLEQLHEAFLARRHEISAIILDGCMPGNSVNTIPFVQFARGSGYRGPIVAASSLDVYRCQMVASGCSHQAPKEQAAELVADLLSAA